MDQVVSVREALADARRYVADKSYLPGVRQYHLADGGVIEVGNKPASDGSRLLGVFVAVRRDAHGRRTRTYRV